MAPGNKLPQRSWRALDFQVDRAIWLIPGEALEVKSLSNAVCALAKRDALDGTSYPDFHVFHIVLC
jgi:hypothetical protein